MSATFGESGGTSREELVKMRDEAIEARRREFVRTCRVTLRDAAGEGLSSATLTVDGERLDLLSELCKRDRLDMKISDGRDAREVTVSWRDKGGRAS